MSHLVIIGNGITGVTTARLVRKMSDMKITIISNESDYFFSRTALMYIFMGHMSYEDTKPYENWFWKKNRITLINELATEIDPDQKIVKLNNGLQLHFDYLLLATGSRSNKFGWPGQDLPGVQGLYSCQDLKLLEKNTRQIRKAVVVGGGLIGIELAEMLLSRDISVTFLVREKQYWDNVLPQEEATLIGRHIREHGIDLRLNTQLKEILAGKNGRVKAVVTDMGEEIACQFVGLTTGVHPNIDLVKNSKVNTDRGILVNDFLKTNIPDIYAAGDCAEIIIGGSKRNKIEQLWYTGKKQAEAVARTICGQPTKYNRGIWFNSAKFLDIEYQTYGFVNNVSQKNEDSFYWEHEDGKHCLRLVFDSGTRAVTGMNFFGTRMRQEVCEQWIKNKKSLDHVLTHLPEANFDPEFFKQYEKQILDLYNLQTGKYLKLKRKRGIFGKKVA